MSTAETIDLMDLEPFTAGTDHALFARLRDEAQRAGIQVL